MEGHRIPQDVTHFQFKLIGQMTIRQFAYLAAGIALAWLVLTIPIHFFLKLPFIVLFAGSGVILAFVPICGRPSDTMVFLFIKALFAPNQYVFSPPPTTLTQNTSQNIAPAPSPTSPSLSPLPTPQPQQVTPPPLPDPVVNVPQPSPIEPPPSSIPPSSPLPTNSYESSVHVVSATTTPTQDQSQNGSSPTTDTSSLDFHAQALEAAIQSAQEEEKKEQHGSAAALATHEKLLLLEQNLQETLLQKQKLEQELLELKKGLPLQATTAPQPVTSPVQQQSPFVVKKVSPPPPTSTLLMPEFPNIITGIAKDPRGNVLPNILVEVKDKDGNPVRAFKTNQLGQFASATPLLIGTYTISFEDPAGKQSFDAIELIADGKIIPPIEVISIDAREELRKELFGK